MVGSFSGAACEDLRMTSSRHGNLAAVVDGRCEGTGSTGDPHPRAQGKHKGLA